MNFDYVEKDPSGGFLDDEKGVIPGFYIDLALQNNDPLVFGLKFERYAGDVDYDGQIESTDPAFDGLPIQTTTSQLVSSVTGKLSYVLPAIPGTSVYGKFSIKRWERDIQPTRISGIDNFGNPFQNKPVSGLFEVYKWQQVTIGMNYKMPLSQASYLRFNGGLLRTIAPKITVDTYGLTLDIRERSGYEAGIKWIYRLHQNDSLGIGLDYMYWEFGRSNTIGGFTEPYSESQMTTFQLIYQATL